MNCQACKDKRLHTEEKWKNHPHRGHGFTKEQGWSLPELGIATGGLVDWFAQQINTPIHPFIQRQIDNANQAMANLTALSKEEHVHNSAV